MGGAIADMYLLINFMNHIILTITRPTACGWRKRWIGWWVRGVGWVEEGMGGLNEFMDWRDAARMDLVGERVCVGGGGGGMDD